MKKLIALFAVLALAAPVFAQETVTLTLTDEGVDGGGDTIIAVTYDASGASQLMSGLAFDLTVDQGATIESIYDFKTGESTSASPGYGIFLGSIDLTDPQNPIWGDPIAPSGDLDALGGLGTGGATIEMGALYDQAVPGDAPLAGPGVVLFRITVDCGGATAVNVAVAAEPTRAGSAGGAVLEPATEGGDPIPADIVCAGLVICDSLCPADGTAAQQAMWLAKGSPASWCDDCWLQGDVPPHDGIIDFADVSPVFTWFKNNPTTYNADYDVNMDGFVDFADVSLVFTNFKNGVTCP